MRLGLPLCSWDGCRPQGELLGGDAERCIGSPVAGVAASAFQHFEEEPFPEILAVELEELAVLVTIVKHVSLTKAAQQILVRQKAGGKVVM